MNGQHFTQPADGLRAILVLRASLARRRDQSGGPMHKPDRGGDFVAMLPTGAAGSMSMYLAFGEQLLIVQVERTPAWRQFRG